MDNKTRFEKEAKGNSEMAYWFCCLCTEREGRRAMKVGFSELFGIVKLIGERHYKKFVNRSYYLCAGFKPNPPLGDLIPSLLRCSRQASLA